MLTRNAEQEAEELQGKMAALQALADGIAERGGVGAFFKVFDAFVAQTEKSAVENILAENERLLNETIVPLPKPDLFAGGES